MSFNTSFENLSYSKFLLTTSNSDCLACNWISKLYFCARKLSNSSSRFFLWLSSSLTSDRKKLTYYSRIISSWIDVTEGDLILFEARLTNWVTSLKDKWTKEAIFLYGYPWLHSSSTFCSFVFRLSERVSDISSCLSLFCARARLIKMLPGVTKWHFFLLTNFVWSLSQIWILIWNSLIY